MGNYQVRFWRAVEGVTSSLTLIILNSGLGTTGHVETSVLNAGNASGESTSILAGESLSGQVGSLKEESPSRDSRRVSISFSVLL